jgi:hypothetical protein
MASDELRAAIASDPQLLEMAADLARLIERSEVDFRDALESGDLAVVTRALRVDVSQLEQYAQLFYENAVELAGRFPEIERQAARWRSGELDV